MKSAECSFKEKLLSSLSSHQFTSNIWDVAPIVLKGLPEIIQFSDFENMIANKNILTQSVKTKFAPSTLSFVPSETYADLDTSGAFIDNVRMLRDLHSSKYSFIVNQAQYYEDKAKYLNLVFSQALDVPCFSNFYFTPPSQQTLALHFDDHHVFLIQASGSKSWKVYAPIIEKPISGQQRSVNNSERTPLVLETVLVPGDILYIPRGFLHEGISDSSEHSLHITIGSRQTHFTEVLNVSLNTIAVRLTKKRMYREELTFKDSLSSSVKGEIISDFSNVYDEVISFYRTIRNVSVVPKMSLLHSVDLCSSSSLLERAIITPSKNCLEISSLEPSVDGTIQFRNHDKIKNIDSIAIDLLKNIFQSAIGSVNIDSLSKTFQLDPEVIKLLVIDLCDLNLVFLERKF